MECLVRIAILKYAARSSQGLSVSGAVAQLFEESIVPKLSHSAKVRSHSVVGESTHNVLFSVG